MASIVVSQVIQEALVPYADWNNLTLAGDFMMLSLFPSIFKKTQ